MNISFYVYLLVALWELRLYQYDCEAAPEERAVYLQGAEAGHAAPDVLRKQKHTKISWLVGSGEPCFQGRPIQYFMNPYAFTLSHCRVMSQDPSS